MKLLYQQLLLGLLLLLWRFFVPITLFTVDSRHVNIHPISACEHSAKNVVLLRHVNVLP